MQKVKVRIIVLGGLKHPVDREKIKKWKTVFFEISNIELKKYLPDSNADDGWYYSDEQLESLIPVTKEDDIVFAIINHELEENYYGRRIGQNIYVLSLHETAEIVLSNNLKIEDFILQTIYYVSALYYKYDGKIPTSDKKITHHDIRGCLFDFNANKLDIAFSLGRVSICDQCKTEFNLAVMPDNFVDSIQTELKRIKKSTYYLIYDFIKRRPILSLFIGGVISILLNFFSSYLYDIIKAYLK